MLQIQYLVSLCVEAAATYSSYSLLYFSFFEHFCSLPSLLLLRVASGETFWKGSMPFFCCSMCTTITIPLHCFMEKDCVSD